MAISPGIILYLYLLARKERNRVNQARIKIFGARGYQTFEAPSWLIFGARGYISNLRGPPWLKRLVS